MTAICVGENVSFTFCFIDGYYDEGIVMQNDAKIFWSLTSEFFSVSRKI